MCIQYKSRYSKKFLINLIESMINLFYEDNFIKNQFPYACQLFSNNKT